LTLTLPPSIETPRFLLRRPYRADIGAIGRALSDDSSYWFPYRRALSRSEIAHTVARDIDLWDDGGVARWLVTDRDDACVMGYLGFRQADWPEELLPALDIVWRLAPWSRGRGAAVECTRAAITALPPLSTVVAVYEPENGGSQAVAARAGFARWRILPDPRIDRVVHVDSLRTPA
jgi:RimJ/RimL family protein N-acetyltransferase